MSSNWLPCQLDTIDSRAIHNIGIHYSVALLGSDLLTHIRIGRLGHLVSHQSLEIKKIWELCFTILLIVYICRLKIHYKSKVAFVQSFGYLTTKTEVPVYLSNTVAIYIYIWYIYTIHIMIKMQHEHTCLRYNEYIYIIYMYYMQQEHSWL